MAHQTLYRKWRPQTFEDIVGQPQVGATLQNAIKLDRLTHAYIFSGPRGTGKTSTARILAKTLNCQKGPALDPCNDCDNCRQITAGNSFDVMEIDAASNRGIDQIRQLRETVSFTPVSGHYKIYIIDESHMLTEPAFNALLKTLEEPPPMTIFILATTAFEKFPATIASRCQRLDFKKITPAEIARHLAKIVKSEKVTASPAALWLIARQADGAMRDALSLLDQIMSYKGQSFDDQDVLFLLGTAGLDFFWQLITVLEQGDAAKALQQLQSALESGVNPGQFIRDLTHHFHLILLTKAQAASDQEIPPDHQEFYQQQARNFSFDRLEAILQRLATTISQTRWHPYLQVLLELTLIQISQITAGPDQESPSLTQDKQPPANKPSAQIPAISSAGSYSQIIQEHLGTGAGQKKKPVETVTPGPAQRSADNSAAASTLATADLVAFKKAWPDLLAKLRSAEPDLAVLLAPAAPYSLKEQDFFIAFPRGYSFYSVLLNEPDHKQALENFLERETGQSLIIRTNATASAFAAAKSSQAITSDPAPAADAFIQKIASFFEGTVIKTPAE